MIQTTPNLIRCRSCGSVLLPIATCFCTWLEPDGRGTEEGIGGITYARSV